eukprot:NODE_11222_length_1300_cov_4.807332.p1 GENE.NODE_11222_length_1300_cov_4.807332~~NODE_11222_length_1300_cov_4.807332.p1  ORF type:complete len:340 (-),score=81.28 NODE_11222_length_1300_cov_4.807332:281-1234(-)
MAVRAAPPIIGRTPSTARAAGAVAAAAAAAAAAAPATRLDLSTSASFSSSSSSDICWQEATAPATGASTVTAAAPAKAGGSAEPLAEPAEAAGASAAAAGPASAGVTAAGRNDLVTLQRELAMLAAAVLTGPRYGEMPRWSAASAADLESTAPATRAPAVAAAAPAEGGRRTGLPAELVAVADTSVAVAARATAGATTAGMNDLAALQRELAMLAEAVLAAPRHGEQRRWSDASEAEAEAHLQEGIASVRRATALLRNARSARIEAGELALLGSEGTQAGYGAQVAPPPRSPVPLRVSLSIILHITFVGFVWYAITL